MARTYLVFGDIEGKLDMLRVECTKCTPRKCSDRALARLMIAVTVGSVAVI